MNDNRSILSIRIDNKMKKKLKLMSVYEDITVTEIVTGFIQYGLKIYESEQTLIKDK